ncbi:MAG: hypothetical protein ACFFCO_02915, partial [Promethearchaeota archaeon]
HITRCVGLVSILRIIQLVIPMTTLFITIILILSIAALTLRMIKSISKEQQRDVFNLSAPTTFDNGFLIFKSRGGKYAIFFAVALSLSSVNFRRLQRILNILLKVFPESSIFSIEWLTNKDCYACFYFKINKDTILTRTRELVENIQTSFKLVFGEEQVRLLSEGELLSQLVYGAQGRIRKATSVERFSVKLETDIDQHVISLAQSPIGMDRVKAILREVTKNGLHRVILSLKKIDAQHALALCLHITSSASRKGNHSVLNKLVKTNSIHRMPASHIIRFIGDILTRNFPEIKHHNVSFESAVKELSSFVRQCSVFTKRIQNEQPTSVDPHGSRSREHDWREILETVSEQLELQIERNVILSVHGFPLRIDAKIQDVFIKIIPEYYNDIEKIQWLLIQLTDIITQKTGKYVFLLPDNPEIAPKIEEALSVMENRGAIHIITSIRKLQELILKSRTDHLSSIPVTAQAV